MKKLMSMILVGILVLSGCAPAQKEKQDKLIIYTTLFPQYDFAKIIGQERVEVRLLLKPGVESHTYEPTPKEVQAIAEGDLFIYTSDLMEPWAKPLTSTMDLTKLMVVEAGADTHVVEHNETHEETSSHDHDHEHNLDPHVWMDLDNAGHMVDTIARALSLKDPEGKDFYTKNAQDYKVSLDALDQNFKEMVRTAPTKTVVFAGHFSLGYLVDRYHLEYVAAYEGGEEPSAKEIAKLLNYVKANEVNFIFHEELMNTALTRMIQKETGTILLELHGLHNVRVEDMDQGVSYLSIMTENYENLKEGLYGNTH